MTVARVYEMDTDRVLAESGFAPPAPDATPQERNRWLRETFYELCGFERDEDHVDGSYVKLVDEFTDTEFGWPDATFSEQATTESRSLT